MRGFDLAIVSLGLCVLFSGVPTLGSTPASMEKPTFFKTDYWKYLTTGDDTIQFPGNEIYSFHITGTRTDWITEVKPTGVSWVEVGFSTTTGTDTYPGPGGAIVTVDFRYDFHYNATGTFTGDEAGSTGYSVRYFDNDTYSSGGQTNFYSIQASKDLVLTSNSFTYPVVPGARGTSVTHGPGHQEYTRWPPQFSRPPTVDATITITTDYVARTFEQATVPAGTFSTLPVDSWANATVQGGNFYYIPDGNRTRTYYTPATGLEAKYVAYNGQGRQYYEENLVEYRYVKPMTGAVGGDVLSGMAPLTVHLNATVAGGLPPYTITWRFGDNSTATGTNPAHTYKSAGSYTVTVSVTDLSGQVVEKNLTISVSPRPWYTSSPFSDPPFWAGVAGVIAILAVITAVVLRRRRRVVPPPPPEGTMPPETPGGTGVSTPQTPATEGQGPPSQEGQPLKGPDEPQI